MKINKRGSQTTNSAQNIIFHSKKNSVHEIPSVNSLIQHACQNNNEKLFGIPSESQPVLKKMSDMNHERVQGNTKPSSRQPSASHHQIPPPNQTDVKNFKILQPILNQKEGSYMLKIQKYKKMKTELNNQTKQIIKKCLNQNPSQAITNPQKSQITIMTPSSTNKHGSTQQILINKIEQSQKENSNQAANSISILSNGTQSQSNNPKSSTLKFSINNLLQEISSRTGAINGLNPTTQSNGQNSNVIVSSQGGQNSTGMNPKPQSKNSHASLIQLKNQQHLSSSKMMMALHKKCNSITNSSSSNILNLTSGLSNHQRKTSNQSIVDLICTDPTYQQQISNDENIPLNTNHIQQQYLGKTPKPYQKQDSVRSDIIAKKNLSVVSQVEFFDENVRVGEVPQITPRHADKKKANDSNAMPNERYKEVDEQGANSSKNNYRSVPLAVLADFTNRQNGIKSKQAPQHISITLNNAQSENHKAQTVRQNNQPDEGSKKIFEMKRRSCGEAETMNHQLNNFIESNNQASISNNDITQGQFTQRKFSHQIVQQQESEIKKQQNFKTSRDSNSQSKKLNPKDQIITFIAKYIKQQSDSNQNKNPNQIHQEIQEQEETLQNLKDFLQYLEDKKIINTKNLENNQKEMTNLIQDLMKLDLHKFSNSKVGLQQQIQNQVKQVAQPQNCKTSNPTLNIQPAGLPPSGYQFQLKRNSADQVISPEVMNDLKFKAAQMQSPQVNNHRYLPVNSPSNINNSNESNPSNNIVCYYSPLNVNGNNNIVNHNVQIYPIQNNPNHPISANNKAFNCSQKLFLQSPAGNNNHIDLSQQQEAQPEIPLRVNAPVHSHKRVNSLHDQSSSSQGPVPLFSQQKTPQVLNSKMNFGFGGQSSQKLILIDQNNEYQQQKPLFHQRKNSMFVQNQKGENNILLNNNSSSQEGKVSSSSQGEEDEAILIATRNKAKAQHRRAATNYIQPSQIIQTIQPQVIPSGTGIDPVFNDDYGLVEEREKLIKYIKAYVKQNIEIPQTTLEFYKFVKLIGKGAFGKVTLGIHKLTGKQVAIKTVDKSLMKDDYQRKKVLQEVYLLKKVRHTNVIRLLEVFESPKHLLMVMEYAGNGDLLQYVKKRRRLDEQEARKIFRQIVYGLAHCHCRSVLHRDIKLDNILLDNDGEIKICDFGVSRVILKNQRINEQCGTPAYIAPEIINDSGYEGFSADIWSLGVLLYAMICGTVPFKAQNMHDLHQLITSGQFSFPSHLQSILSNESKDLIQRMLVLNPKDRITIPQILSHPWMLIKDDQFMLSDDPMDLQNGMSKKDFMMSINEENTSDINQVNVDNLFPNEDYNTKLSYTDYCAITQDFATMHLDEESLQVLEGFGFSRKQVRDGLNKGDLNHATASYNLLVLS